jgi:hypothetical protein
MKKFEKMTYSEQIKYLRKKEKQGVIRLIKFNYMGVEQAPIVMPVRTK